MGCPLSSTLADLYMDAIDIEINSLKLRPRLWIRYVDDVFAIWPHGKRNLDLFLKKINSINPAIKFTMEIEINHTLPFLDVLVNRDENNRFSTTVYRKPNTNSAPPHYSSAHPWAQKTSAFSYFINRAHNICSNQKLLKKEINTIFEIATNRGYPHSVVNNAIRKFKNKQDILTTTTLTSLKNNFNNYAIVPYIPKLSHKIGSILSKHNIKPVFKPIRKTSDIFNNYKTKIDKSEASGIYSIPCDNCNLSYIGQTKRNF